MTRHKKWQRYYIKPSESLIVRQCFHYSCLLLYWYRRRYFNPLHTHKHHEDDMQNTWTVILVSLFLELLSFEQWTKSFLPCTCVRTVSWKLFKIFSGNFTQMQTLWNDVQVVSRDICIWNIGIKIKWMKPQTYCHRFCHAWLSLVLLNFVRNYAGTESSYTSRVTP